METVRRHFWVLRGWFRWAEVQASRRARDVRAQAVLSYVEHCRVERRHRPRTVSCYWETFSLFTRFLHESGVLAEDPLEHVTVLRGTPNKRERVLSTEELEVVVGSLRERAACHVPHWGWHHRRDLLLCKVLIATGLRAKEICALRVGDFDPVAGTLAVEGKGGGRFAIRGRRVFVSDPLLLGELRTWANGLRHSRGALFPSYRGRGEGRSLGVNGLDSRIRSWGQLAGLARPLHAHLFRSTFCSHLIANGADVYSVQQLMGHACVEVTLDVYLSLTEAEVRAQWRRHNPLPGVAAR